MYLICCPLKQISVVWSLDQSKCKGCPAFRYICHICRGSFTELWDLDDHVNEVHINIWCTYMDVDATTALPDDIFVRSISAKGLIHDAPVQPATDPSKSECTKCGKISATLPDLHTHMLECGGDTTWMLISPRKKKQWRPFGTRRRARRGMKRIPSSPVKLNRTNRKLDGQCFSALNFVGQVGGLDLVTGDSIQKMIANLPSKRGSRRVINFNDDDIKTRSQATIHSVSSSALLKILSLFLLLAIKYFSFLSCSPVC